MISLLIINYRSAAWTAEAIRTARASTASAMQVVVVDNSCDPVEAARLVGLADELIIAERNTGYAGGINLGRRACQGGTLVVSNPDVTFAAGAIDFLQEALTDAAAAGPALFWDAAHTWMLPPGDLHTGWHKVDEILASRSSAWHQERDRRRFRRRVAFWSLQKTARVRMLSGAVLAIRAVEFDRLGGFDERFPLYFEETDFLRRLSEARRNVAYVPAARCHHSYNQSAAQVPAEAEARYAQSELRYLEKWNGPLAARVLKKIERSQPAWPIVPLRLPLILERNDVVIELSPLETFSTAAGFFPKERPEVHIPPEILATVAGTLYARVVVQKSGEVLGAYKIER